MRFIIFLFVLIQPVFASGGGDVSHSDPFASILVGVAIIIAGALFGRWAAIKVKQPAVLGELLFGVIFGNIGYLLDLPQFILIMHMDDMGRLFNMILSSGLGVTEAAIQVFTAAELQGGAVGDRLTQIFSGPGGSSYIMTTLAFWMFSSLGVILLLFMVGLETSVDEMMKVGSRALLVAVIGIVAPFLLGLAAGEWLLPELSMSAHLFLAATLCATSVGITARVFQDLGRIQSNEAKMILGAAVIDDILGLIILAVVAGLVTTGGVAIPDVVRILLLSVIFLGGIVFFGEKVLKWTIPAVVRLDRRHGKLLYPLSVVFVLSWLASQIELATIVGAFAAGLVLHEKLFEKYADSKLTMEELFGPIETIFAPIFFVLMGMQVNIQSFMDMNTVWLATAFTVVAIVGKLVCGLGAGKNIDKLSVGIGMVPRGEVGLIFASIGKGLGVVSGGVFSAIVMMVIVTTLITPILLRWSLFRGEKAVQ